MTVSNVGSGSAFRIQSLVDLQNQFDDLQRQLTTGKKTNSYAGLGLDCGLTMGLRSQLAAIGSYDDTITALGTRLSVAQTALTAIDTSAHAVMNSATNSTFVLNSSGQTADQRAASGQLDQILGALNSQVGDKYIFSGKSPDQPPVASIDDILNGDATHAGLKQVMAERKQADLGADGLGRLLILAAAGATVAISEDAVSPFGLKLASVNSALTGAAVSGPAGTPASVSIDLTAATLNDGDTIKFSFNLPDGSSEDLTLTATTSATPGPNEFTIGTTAAASAANLQSALTTSVGKLADTSLVAASAVAAANDFFAIDAANPPRRVAGPPFDSATSLVAGTSANTVTWYTGEAGSDPARSTATARVDPAIIVSGGMRANEQAIRSAVQNIAVFATMSFSASDPNAADRYAQLTQRIGANLAVPSGSQKISDIEAEIASAQTTMTAAKDQHQHTSWALNDLLQNIESVPTEQVGAQILELQTRLQASLETTALLAKTSLVNYL